MPTARDAAGNIVSSDGADSVVALPYSTSITPNADFGRIFTIVATDTVAFAINAPSNPRIGRIISFDIKNSSGGIMGAITWNAIFKMGAFTNPGNGLRSTISFYYDGANWVALHAQSLAS